MLEACYQSHLKFCKLENALRLLLAITILEKACVCPAIDNDGL